MSWGSFLKAAAPIAAGILGGPAAAAVVGGAVGYLSDRAAARDVDRTTQAAAGQANQGFNYLTGATQPYAQAGQNAVNAQQGLLGIGGDPAASGQAYQNYLGSVGYQHQMKSGQQAITGSRAASGLLGSGSTARALTQYGQDLSTQNFNNYLTQVGGVAQQGLNAIGMTGQAGTYGGIAGANIMQQGGMAAAGIRQSGREHLMDAGAGVFKGATDWLKNRSGGGSGGTISPIAHAGGLA